MTTYLQEKETYLDRFARAVVVAREKGAVMNALAACAQGALESAWGTSELATKGNNLFGVKSSPNDTQALRYWTWEQDPQGRYYRTQAFWKTYPSYNECLVDYSNIINTLTWFEHSIPHADPPHGDGNATFWLAGLMWPGLPRWSTETSDHYVSAVAALFPEIGDLASRFQTLEHI